VDSVLDSDPGEGIGSGLECLPKTHKPTYPKIDDLKMCF
jgi:hypothetical protein